MVKASFHREDYIKKRRKQFYIKIGVAVFGLLLLLIVLIFISRMDRFRISNIEFVGGLLVSPDEIKKETNSFLSGYYFWFFPKNNILLYPHDKLEDFLKEKFKRIDTISIGTISNTAIRISIKERGLYALWCDNQPESSMYEKCYFMDSNGVIFSESPIFSGDAYFKYYGSISSDTNPIGSTYISSSTEFVELSHFIERVKATVLHPVYLVAKENNQFDIILFNGGHIYLDDSESFSKTADNLDALLRTISTTTSANDLDIEYIDLRFGNKLFYKLKNTN